MTARGLDKLDPMEHPQEYSQVPQPYTHAWQPCVNPLPGKQPTVPPTRRRSVKWPLAALLLLIIITASLIALVFTRLSIFKGDRYDNRTGNVWTFGIAIIATVCATFVRKQLKVLWLKEVDRLLESTPAGPARDALDKRWRTTLQIAHITERWGNLTNFRVDLSYMIASLLFACISAGFSIQNEFRKVEYRPEIPVGQDYFCANTTTALDPDQISSYWELNSQYYQVFPTMVGCPPTQILPALGNINPIDPREFAYSDMGVAVKNTAIGAPASIYGWVNGRDRAVIGLSSVYRVGLLSTWQCVPVMKRNPISCRQGGTVEQKSNNMTVISKDRSCSYMGTFASNPVDFGRAMVKHICYRNEFGKATIVLGALGGWAATLGDMINEPTSLDEFAVTCTVNVTPETFEYRWVKLSFQSDFGDSGVSFGKSLVGGEACAGPSEPAGTNARIGLAAASSSELLIEGHGDFGWSQTLSKITLDDYLRPREKNLGLQ
ncbi:MAG: hypothetical protein M1813_007955 [Trichoglossum hirsutum]|nr:MAG: hypothetical protein M1813_007955 [Trichoglossum hirsutum]